MRINREELTKKYLPPFTDFGFGEKTVFAYRGNDYDLTDKSSLAALVSRANELKDYAVCKIANNILAVAEIKSGDIIYKHTPVIMHVELSSFCNCECMMCRHCYEKNAGAKYLPPQAFEQLKKYLPACKLAVINGYGEPFIHPQISEIISVFAEYGVKILTTTNAQHIPAGCLDKINKTFMRINVSCDGATEETYRSIRRRASFKKFKENVKLLRDNCPNVELFMSAVAMRQNISEATELVQLAKECGFKEIRFGRLGSNLFLNNQRDELVYYPNYASLMLERARREGERLGVNVIVPLIMKNARIDFAAAEREKEELEKDGFFKDDAYYESLAAEYLQKRERGEFKPRPYSLSPAIGCSGMCHWIGFGMFINASGKVRPCAEIPLNAEQEEREEQIDFNYSELREFRESFVSGKVPAVCMDCAFIMSDEVGTLKVDLTEYKKYFAGKAANNG